MKLKCINNEPLKGRKKPLMNSEHAPPLIVGEVYELLDKLIEKDKDGNEYEHWDVGLKCELMYVTSFETGEELSKYGGVHWCHPSRFEIVED